MSDNNEPSYYEIALTNRQVLIAFVVILGSILVSFLSGVWVGRKDAPRPGEGQLASIAENDPASEYEQLGFFDRDSDADPVLGEPEKPDLKPLLGPPPSTGSTLAEEVGSAPPAAPPPPPKPRQQAPPPPEPVPPPPPKTASPPAAAAQEGFVIQVFSTRDEPQARKVLKRLKDGGFSAFMSPVQVDQQAMYRVRVGPFRERAEADEQAKKVRSKFRLDTWVTAASN